MGVQMIPKGFVDKYVNESEGASFFGVPIEDLSRNELIAWIMHGREAEKNQIKESARKRSFILSCRK